MLLHLKPAPFREVQSYFKKACDYDLAEFAGELLNNGADPNKTLIENPVR